MTDSTVVPAPSSMPGGVVNGDAVDRDAVGTAETPGTPGQTRAEGDTSDGAQRPEDGAQDERERDESGRLLSKEAAAYRRRLRDTETERDQLRSRLDQMQRGEAERLAQAAGLAAPADLWVLGGELEFLRGEDGSIDQDRVAGAVADILKERPGLRAPVRGDIGIGRGSAAAGRPVPQQVGLSQLLKP